MYEIEKIDGDLCLTVGRPTGQVVAIVDPFYDMGGKDAEVTTRLLAAAPDLLDALKALYEHCTMIHKHWGEDCNQKEAKAAIKAGVAAIARAEGRVL